MMGLLIKNWWALALRGAFAVIFGLLAIFLPGLTLEALVLVFGVYATVDGIFAIVAGIRAAERHERWIVLALEGLVGIVAGLIALFIPLAAAFGFLIVFGAWAIATGIFEIAAAIRLRREMKGEWLLAVDGILSILLGLLVVVFPGIGLIALVWCIGAYALIFGFVLIALAFRLRARRPVPATAEHP
jgi:uncharacterized membrane protein HdeD (DUF308 family)